MQNIIIHVCRMYQGVQTMEETWENGLNLCLFSCPFWSQLELALSKVGQLLLPSHRSHSAASTTKTSSHKPNTPSFFGNSAASYISVDRIYLFPSASNWDVFSWQWQDRKRLNLCWIWRQVVARNSLFLCPGQNLKLSIEMKGITSRWWSG